MAELISAETFSEESGDEGEEEETLPFDDVKPNEIEKWVWKVLASPEANNDNNNRDLRRLHQLLEVRVKTHPFTVRKQTLFLSDEKMNERPMPPFPPRENYIIPDKSECPMAITTEIEYLLYEKLSDTKCLAVEIFLTLNDVPEGRYHALQRAAVILACDGNREAHLRFSNTAASVSLLHRGIDAPTAEQFDPELGRAGCAQFVAMSEWLQQSVPLIDTDRYRMVRNAIKVLVNQSRILDRNIRYSAEVKDSTPLLNIHDVVIVCSFMPNMIQYFEMVHQIYLNIGGYSIERQPERFAITRLMLERYIEEQEVVFLLSFSRIMRMPANGDLATIEQLAALVLHLGGYDSLDAASYNPLFAPIIEIIVNRWQAINENLLFLHQWMLSSNNEVPPVVYIALGLALDQHLPQFE